MISMTYSIKDTLDTLDTFVLKLFLKVAKGLQIDGVKVSKVSVRLRKVSTKDTPINNCYYFGSDLGLMV
jgi:hypothetical protein